jgi:phosphoribosylformylglycinamidine cyclo-ligase
MFKTFNMGIGYAVIVSPEEAERAKEVLEACGERVYRIGRIEKGERGVEIR